MFKYEITLGDALTLAVSTLALCLSVGMGLWRFFRSRSPLRLDYSNEPYEELNKTVDARAAQGDVGLGLP